MKKLSLVAATAASVIAPMVSAYQAGDTILRAGVAYVVPNKFSETGYYVAKKEGEAEFAVIGNTNIEKPDNATKLGAALTYMVSDQFGLELSSVTPYKQSMKLDGTIHSKGTRLPDFDYSGSLKVGSIKAMPINLILQAYLLKSDSPFQPYVGAGINYTNYSTSDKDNHLSKFDASNTWGGVAQIGADYKLTENLLLNAAATYNQSATDIKVALKPETAAGIEEKNVSLDPWTFQVGLGYKF